MARVSILRLYPKILEQPKEVRRGRETDIQGDPHRRGASPVAVDALIGQSSRPQAQPARLLLFADEAVDGLRRTDQEIAATLGIGPRTVERVRQRFVEEGLESALVPRPRPRGAYKVDRREPAQIIAIAKSDPPPGRKRWTLRLIADRLVALGHGAVSPEAVRQVLKKRRDPVARGDVVLSSQG